MESVQPESLEAFHKSVNLKELARERYHELIARIRKGGIAVLGAFVLGCDTDDPGVFPRTLEFIRSSGIDVIQVTKPTPLPGTELWNPWTGKDGSSRRNSPETGPNTASPRCSTLPCVCPWNRSTRGSPGCGANTTAPPLPWPGRFRPCGPRKARSPPCSRTNSTPPTARPSTNRSTSAGCGRRACGGTSGNSAVVRRAGRRPVRRHPGR
ncbi:MAG: hypothetical protein M0C28_23460 [Candidatus Moduliflexus flocculans]|nr:hypothetical protein [Candidatus Moduliflexus flocculans]